jgi:DNA-binding NarL/FixJ family response regulator
MRNAGRPARSGPLRVLLADDSAVVRDRIAALIAAVDAVTVVGQPRDTDAALVAIEATRPDVVVLDLFMPGGGGLVVLNALAGRPVQPVVIVFTNFPDEEYRVACARLGVDHFLDKSHDAPTLLRLIETLAAES